MNAIPGAVLNGSSTIETGINNLTGVECSIADEYKNSPIPAIYNATQLLIVCVILICMVYCYGCIWRTISKSTTFNTSQTSASKCPSEESSVLGSSTCSISAISGTSSNNSAVSEKPNVASRKYY